MGPLVAGAEKEGLLAEELEVLGKDDLRRGTVVEVHGVAGGTASTPGDHVRLDINGTGDLQRSIDGIETRIAGAGILLALGGENELPVLEEG